MAERYEIRKKIGSGGLGDIFVAYDTQLDREVAMKRIRQVDGEEGGEDLFKEAKVLSTLQHPNIVTVFDVGRDEEGSFVVMELLKGETLDETVERGALTLEDFQQLVVQTCEGMIAAAAVGLLHRDLKPSNIMVIWLPSGKFQVKILDFGLAKFSKGAEEQTSDQEDGILGSIFFMAPEQFERSPLDTRTDMYSLGCVYYHALTQQHPFQGESAAQVMASHLRHDVRDLRIMRPDLPPEVCTWVMWMINRKMDNRPKDAKDALYHFRAAVEGQTVPGQPMVVTGVPQVAPAATGAIPVTSPVPAAAPPGMILSGTGLTGPVPVQGGATGSVVGIPEGKKEFLPKWAMVTFPLLVAAAVGLGIWKVTKTGKERREHESFLEMVDSPSPKGDSEVVKKLIGFLTEENSNSRAAWSILSKLEGPGVNQAIVNGIERLSGDAQINLVKVIAVRGYTGAFGDLVELAETTDNSTLRQEALWTLGEIARDREIPQLLELLVSMDGETEKAVLEASVVRLCRARSGERLRVDPLLKLLSKKPAKDIQSRIVRMLGQIGGKSAFGELKKLVGGSDTELREAAISSLGQWNNAEPSELLLGIATGGGGEFERTLALLSYAEIAGRAGDLPMEERVEMLGKALNLSEPLRGGRQKIEQQVFAQLANLPSSAALEYAESFKGDERLGGFAELAISAVSKILPKVVELGEEGGTLEAKSASIRGDDAEYLSRPGGRGVIGTWTDPNTWLTWYCTVTSPGAYALKVEQAAGPRDGGSYEISVAGRSFSQKVKETGDTDIFAIVDVVDIAFDKPGGYQVSIRPVAVREESLMLLRSVALERKR